MKVTLAAFVLILVCVSSAPAWALYCGHRLVSPGETQTTVWYKCGAPDTTTWQVHYRAVREVDAFGTVQTTAYVPVVVEVWVYNFGPRRFLQEFSFEDGRLIGIEPLGYGY